MIKRSADKNQRKENKSQKDKARIYSPNHSLLHEAKRRPRRGTTTAKTSPPPSDGSRIAGNGAAEGAGAGAVEELRTGGAVELGTGATKELDTRASEEVGTGTSEELTPGLRLLQKSSRLKVKTKKRNSMQQEYENNSPLHDEGYFIILFSLSQGN